MNKAFEQIALIEKLIAAAFVSPEGKLLGWCANSAISPDNLCFVAETCRVILSATRGEQRPAHLGAAVFGNRTVIFREGSMGLFLAYVDSLIDDEVISWLFNQVDPLLAQEGVNFE